MPEHVIKEVLGTVPEQVVWVSKRTRQRYWPDEREVGRTVATTFPDRARFRLHVNALYDREGNPIETIDREEEWGLADRHSLAIPDEFSIEYAIQYGERIDLTLQELNCSPDSDWERLYPGETVEDHHLELMDTKSQNGE